MGDPLRFSSTYSNLEAGRRSESKRHILWRFESIGEDETYQNYSRSRDSPGIFLEKALLRYPTLSRVTFCNRRNDIVIDGVSWRLMAFHGILWRLIAIRCDCSR